MSGTDEALQEVQFTDVEATTPEDASDQNLSPVDLGIEEAAEAPAPVTEAVEDETTDEADAEEDSDDDAVSPFDPESWDPERQKRDQEHANTVKSLESQIEELQNRAEEPAKETPQKAGPDLAAEAEAVMAKVAELDEDADVEDLAKAVKLLGATLAKAAKQSATPKVDSEVKKELEALKAELAADKERNAQDSVNQQYRTTVDNLAKEHGKQYRNGAASYVGQQLEARGYTDGALPTLDYLELLWEKGFRVTKAASKGTSTVAETPVSLPIVDPGVGGTTVAPPKQGGSLQEVLALMQKEGKVR